MRNKKIMGSIIAAAAVLGASAASIAPVMSKSAFADVEEFNSGYYNSFDSSVEGEGGGDYNGDEGWFDDEGHELKMFERFIYYVKDDNTVCIHSFASEWNGDDPVIYPEVIIPDEIDGMPVTSVRSVIDGWGSIKKLIIPKTVKELGFSYEAESGHYFNIRGLEELEYGGTLAEWNEIAKACHAFDLGFSSLSLLKCSDGEIKNGGIVVDGTHGSVTTYSGHRFFLAHKGLPVSRLLGSIDKNDVDYIEFSVSGAKYWNVNYLDKTAPNSYDVGYNNGVDADSDCKIRLAASDLYNEEWHIMVYANDGSEGEGDDWHEIISDDPVTFSWDIVLKKDGVAVGKTGAISSDGYYLSGFVYGDLFCSVTPENTVYIRGINYDSEVHERGEVIPEVVIPEEIDGTPVTEIKWLGSGDRTAKKVTIPKTVTKMGDYIEELGKKIFSPIGIEEIVYGGTKEMWNKLTDNNALIYPIEDGPVITITCTDGVITFDPKNPAGSSDTSDAASTPSTDTSAPATSTPAPATSTPAESEPAPQETLKNTDTGVELEAAAGVVPEGAALTVEEGTEVSEDEVAFDITLVKDGSTVQPDGTVTVKIPVPEKFKAIAELYVYFVENGVYTLMPSKLVNGFVVFDTTHFSTYVVSTKKLAEKPAVATGAPAIAAVLGAAAVAGGVLLVAKKRK